MKIAFYTPRISALTPGTSGDRILVPRLIDGLRERGHEVEVISHVGVYDFWRGRVSARRLLAEALSVRRRARRFAPDAWLVYGTSATYPDVFGWWQRPARYVLLNTTGGAPTRLDWRWRWLFTQLHRRSLGRAQAVIAVRAKSSDLLSAAGVEAPRLRLLPPAVESFPEIPAQEDARRRLGLPLDVPIVLCVGRMTPPRPDGSPWKTEWLLALLDAFADAPVAPGTLLVLVGDGEGRARVEDRIAERGLGERVRLTGAVEHDQMGLHYAAADLFAYLATSDRIWHSAMEALACARPVVTLRNRSTELVIEHGRTGLLAADSDQFGEHLVALSRDRALCAKLGQAARAGVQQAHSIERRILQIEALLAGQEEPPLRAGQNGRPRPRPARTVLVTGGLGFIGSFVSESMAARGDRVTIVDSGVSSVIEPDELDASAGSIRCLPVSVEQFLAEGPGLAEFDLVVHCAAHVGPAALLSLSGRIGPAIVEATAMLVEACIDADVPLVNFSSAEVYGRSGILREGDDVRVPSRYSARIEYALGKLTAEAMVVNSGERGLRAIVVRPFNIAGPRQSRFGGFVLPTFVQQALAGEPLTVFASGRQRRAFLAVGDLCRFLNDHVTEELLAAPRVINLGNPANDVRIHDLAVRVRDRLESSSEVLFTDAREIHGPTYEEAESFLKLPDVRQATALGWEPEVGLDALIDETARYYRLHADARAAKGRTESSVPEGSPAARSPRGVQPGWARRRTRPSGTPTARSKPFGRASA